MFIFFQVGIWGLCDFKFSEQGISKLADKASV